jgi:hypothetical protein
MAEFQDDLDDLDRDHQKAMIDWLKDKSPDVWFDVSKDLNWDNSERVLDWIVSQPSCDRANAAFIFWNASPDYYMENYARREGLEATGRRLIEKILRNWKTGFYQRAELRGDEDHRKRYRDTIARLPGRHDPFSIPADLLGPFKGREPKVPREHDKRYNKELRRLFWNLGTSLAPVPGSAEAKAIKQRVLSMQRQAIWTNAKSQLVWNLKMIAVMVPIGVVVVAGAFFLRWWNKGLLF